MTLPPTLQNPRVFVTKTKAAMIPRTCLLKKEKIGDQSCEWYPYEDNKDYTHEMKWVYSPGLF